MRCGKLLFGLVAAVLAVGPVMRGEEAAATKPAALYTACNLWYENPTRMSCINYEVGAIIPAGSEVRNVAVQQGRRPMIIFTVAATGITHQIEFNAKWHPGLTIDTFKDRLFTGKDLAALTEKFTDQEKQCVKSGTVVTGISKEAVLVACGYPPEHRTPGLTSQVWTYWLNRHRMRAITFDQDGKVAAMQ